MAKSKNIKHYNYLNIIWIQFLVSECPCNALDAFNLPLTNHSFRATGITNYMEHGSRLDVDPEWANHADPRTTGVYDHSSDQLIKI